MSTGQEQVKLLLVEDDVRLAELIADYIGRNGFQVTVEHRGDQAVSNFQADNTDIIILDLMLPGMDGLQVCQQVRTKFTGPILILTAKNSDLDHVMGLELGADDFVTKPIEPPVLLARLRALLRRSQQTVTNMTEQSSELSFGQLALNRKAQQVTLQQKNIELTTQEFSLLWLLAENAGVVLSRDLIFTKMRGIEYDGFDRSVDVRISQLRKKLDDHGEQPTRLKTVWGKGYLFVADAWG
ncbi:MAG: two-component system, OmpR family, response regulator [Methyloprofundus sp.]|nr:MAG: two-component system, OmpR family, response regulator [Methyloprofundus sp.]